MNSVPPPFPPAIAKAILDQPIEQLDTACGVSGWKNPNQSKNVRELLALAVDHPDKLFDTLNAHHTAAPFIARKKSFEQLQAALLAIEEGKFSAKNRLGLEAAPEIVNLLANGYDKTAELCQIMEQVMGIPVKLKDRFPDLDQKDSFLTYAAHLEEHCEASEDNAKTDGARACANSETLRGPVLHSLTTLARSLGVTMKPAMHEK